MAALAAFLQDLRFGVRKLVSTPGFTAVAVISLALGLGANTVIFSLVYGILLRSLPYEHPERLVLVWEHDRDATSPVEVAGAPPGMLPLSVPALSDLDEQNQVFTGMAGFFPWSSTLAGEPQAERVDASVVSPNLFDVLAVEPVLGRGFLTEEAKEGNNRVVVLGHGLWQSRFGGDPRVLGRTVKLDGEENTVVGVMPAGFDFPAGARIWKPFALPPAPRDFNFIRTIARLDPGVSLTAAQADMDAIARGLEELYPDTNEGRGVRLVRLDDHLVGEVRPALAVLQAAIVLVLLIACVNVMNLLLFRSTVRQGEIAVRTMLGAGRRRLVRQLLTEALLLAVLGGIAGLLLAHWGLRGLLPLLERNVPRIEEVSLDRAVLTFSAAISLATTLLFGLVPALHASRADFGRVVRAGFHLRESRPRGLQQVAVVAQVALALTLIVGAGLMAKSFYRLLSVDPGFRVGDVLTLQINLLPETRYADQRATTSFYSELLRRVESLPGVEVAGATWRVPMGTGGSGATPVEVEGDPDAGEGEAISIHPATPGYFRAMGVPLVAGRLFTGRDDGEAPPVAIVNETLARRLWPGESPLGKRLTFGASFGPAGRVDRATREVVGVIGDVRQDGIDQPAPSQLYFPYFQSAWRWSTLVVRSAYREPASLAKAVRGELQAVDPELAPNEVLTLAELVAKSMAQRRLSMVLLSALAVIALVLAAVGVYGVISFAVSQRTRELGIHMALGARRGVVVWLVLRRSFLLGLSGVLLGLLAAWWMTRYLESLLYEVSSLDVTTFAGVALTLMVVSLLASYLPARRASRVDPVAAIRYE